MKIPKEWTFKNSEIAENFDRHVREQLPWYDIVTDGVVHIAGHYVPEGGRVYDIGSSTGNIGRALVPIIVSRAVEFIPIEASHEMAEKYDGPGGLIIKNALKVDIKPFDVAICFLSLMFFPVDQRKRFISQLISKLNVGGCVIIVDKCEPKEGYISTVFWRMTLSAKKKAGISSDEIVDKELSLSGIQRPLCNELMNNFGNCSEWFRFGDFAGWVIEKNAA